MCIKNYLITLILYFLFLILNTKYGILIINLKSFLTCSHILGLDI